MVVGRIRHFVKTVRMGCRLGHNVSLDCKWITWLASVRQHVLHINGIEQRLDPGVHQGFFQSPSLPVRTCGSQLPVVYYKVTESQSTTIYKFV